MDQDVENTPGSSSPPITEKTHNVSDPESPSTETETASLDDSYTVFPRPTRRFITCMITLSAILSPMTANMYFPALSPIALDLGVSITLVNLTLTTYMVMQAIAPPLVGDFGDTAGRRPAFIICFSIYIVANLALALQHNYAALLVLRLLQSAGSSGTLALCFAVIADISVSAERGKYMGILGAGINVGPSLSPVLGGILTEYLGWRSIFWFCLIFSGVWLVPYVLAVPETSRNVVGNGSIPATGWNMTLIQCLRSRRHPITTAHTAPDGKRKVRLPNPFNALRVACEKDVALLYLYSTLVYVVFLLVCATLSPQFAAIYHLNDLQLGLCFLPYGIGCVSAAAVQGCVLDWNYCRVARQIGFTIDYRRGDDLRTFPIEKARIQPVVPFLVVGTLCTIAYGWVLQRETHLAGPLVLLFIIGLCITGSFSILMTLVVDMYPQAPATAVAGGNLVRCLFGAGGTAVVEPMLQAMGRGWTFTLLGLLLVVFSPVLLMLSKWGPRFREERRVRMQLGLENTRD